MHALTQPGRPLWFGLIAMTLVLAGAPPVQALEHPVRVSVYQGPCREGDFAANLATARGVLQQARERASHFLAFPECFLSGYASAEAVRQGARGLEDAALQAFIRESAEHDIVVIIGLARRAGSALHNTALVIQRGRLLGYADKVVLTPDDRDALGFSAGQNVPVFAAHGVRFGVAICADTSYPHVALAAKLQGAELLFTPHFNEIAADVADDHRRWVRHCHIGLAAQLKLAVARANVIKTDRPGWLGYGDSFILSPAGRVLAEAGLFQTALLTAEVTPDLFSNPQVWGDLHDVPAWLRLQLADLLADFRPPRNDRELREVLESMSVYHQYSAGEISAATGLTLGEVAAALDRFKLVGKTPPPFQRGEPLRVRPFPGGRHPRLGFFDGAVMPQRETKVSVFPPWRDGGYVVVDVPEAIFSNLGLTYLAHTHIPTLWEARGIKLERQEWQRHPQGHLTSERTFPNGIAFGAEVHPHPDRVAFTLWLRNSTSDTLTGLRVQNCVMLGAAPGFAAQTTANKVFRPPFAAVRSDDGRRWIITAWERCGRAWGNDLVPCLHADPVFPDCPPGQTVRVRGALWFHEGEELETFLDQLQPQVRAWD